MKSPRERVIECIRSELKGVYTACTALVTEVKSGTCNIKLEDGEDTELFDVPVSVNVQKLHHHDIVTINGTNAAGPEISDTIQEGDRVLVVFSKYPLAGASARRFNLNDGVIVAKLGEN
jgi:hypothetical protein